MNRGAYSKKSIQQTPREVLKTKKVASRAAMDDKQDIGSDGQKNFF